MKKLILLIIFVMCIFSYNNAFAVIQVEIVESHEVQLEKIKEQFLNYDDYRDCLDRSGYFNSGGDPAVENSSIRYMKYCKDISNIERRKKPAISESVLNEAVCSIKGGKIVNGSCVCAYSYSYDKNGECKKNDDICNGIYVDSVWNKEFNSSGGLICDCKDGYSWNSLRTSCIDDVCLSENSSLGHGCYCNNGYRWDKAIKKCISNCNDGYIMKNNVCISYTEDCKNAFGNNVSGKKGNNTSDCYCNSGYRWNDSMTSCVVDGGILTINMGKEKISGPSQIKLYKNIENINGTLYGKRIDGYISDKCDKNSSKVKGACICNNSSMFDSIKNECIKSESARITKLINSVIEKGKEKISSPSKIKLYKNIEKIGNDLYGIKK